MNPPGPIDAATAAHYVRQVTGRPCAPGTIRYWASIGKLTRHGTAGRKTLYSLLELHRLVTGEHIDWAA